MKTLAALLLTVLIAGQAQAQQRILYFAGYGGSTEGTLRQRILPSFERAHGVEIRYVAGASAANLARLQAQRGNPEIDVALLDDGPMEQAAALGLCTDVEPSIERDSLYPLARLAGGRAVGLGLVSTGIAYNTQVFAREGWPAPTSWNDLGDARFRRRLLVPSITNTYGLHTLLMLARAAGGDEGRIEPGFTAMTRTVAPNVLSFETSSAKISELFQTGAVSIGVWGNGRVHALAGAGFPIAFVVPAEGAVALQTALCPVSGSDVPDLAQALIRHLLSPASQAILAAEAGWGPTNRATTLTPPIAGQVIYGPEAVQRLIAPDWAAINAARAEWTRRWTRTVER
ncbi:ABC transporter substrate-binding protein [Roseomonas sp. CECT 9278]|uniref:ABC transporter substrate-binding protein n=1 Tax=Roseomonas sp. CECT 9278 TaxID=2845823 RepID=UPI001E420F04|nr:ABC transporter substrate-binding protein [Roseomonas sp. CECT 9278]CAH0161389.1 hypothetical protein ROS9278_00970 [Roseomonas sp. CECT 9278]